MHPQGKEKTVFQEKLSEPDITPSVMVDEDIPEGIHCLTRPEMWFEEKVSLSLELNPSFVILLKIAFFSSILFAFQSPFGRILYSTRPDRYSGRCRWKGTRLAPASIHDSRRVAPSSVAYGRTGLG